jgi:hypothetical protein
MLLPDKHITLAESILGLGAFVLSELLRSPQSVDRLYERVVQSNGSPALPAYHDFDAMLLAILFLYSIGTIELSDKGVLRPCAS